MFGSEGNTQKPQLLSPGALNHLIGQGLGKAEAVRHLFVETTHSQFRGLATPGTLYSTAAAQASWEGVIEASSPVHLPAALKKGVVEVSSDPMLHRVNGA